MSCASDAGCGLASGGAVHTTSLPAVGTIACLDLYLPLCRPPWRQALCPVYCVDRFLSSRKEAQVETQRLDLPIGGMHCAAC